MDNFSNQQNGAFGNNSIFNASVIDALSLVSLFIGLQNLELNVTARDLDKQGDRILKEIHQHLTSQDEHLTFQDKHLVEQDKRLDLIERYIETVIAETNPDSRKENKNG